MLVGVSPPHFLNGDLTALAAEERKARLGAVTELTVGTFDENKRTENVPGEFERRC